MTGAAIKIVFLLIVSAAAGDVQPDGSASSYSITEIPFPYGADVAYCEAHHGDAILAALQKGQIDTDAVLFGAECVEVPLADTKGA